MEGAPTPAARAYTGSSYMPSADPGTTGGGTYNGESLEPTIEAYENIFGPSARDIKTDLQRFKRHGRWHLPDILKGPNQYLTDRVDGLITDATNSPFTSAILPYKYITNVDGKIKWNVWSFDEGLASRVPYESAARTLQQSKQSFSGYAVRQGMAIVLEHNFMMSDAGRQNFKNQLNQLIGSIQMTNDLDVHTALVLAQSYHAKMREKYIADDKTPSQVCREFIDLFGFMQKNVNALDILIEEAKSQLQVWGSPMPDFMLANSKLTFNMQMTPERTSYVTQGPEGQKRLNTGPNISSYRGIGIIHTRAFSMETGAPPRDILRRRVRVAEYYRIAPHPDNKNRIFQLYNEERDTWFGMPFSDLLKFSHLGDADDVDVDTSYHYESNRHIKSIGTQAVTTKPMQQALDKNLVRRLCMQRFSAIKPRRGLGTVAHETVPAGNADFNAAYMDATGRNDNAFKVADASTIEKHGKYRVVPGHVPLYTDSVTAWFVSESTVNPDLCRAFFGGAVPDQVPPIDLFKYNAIQEYPAYIHLNSNVQAKIDSKVNGLSMGMKKLLYRHMFSYGRLVGDGVMDPVKSLENYIEDTETFFANTVRSKTGAFLCPNLHFSSPVGKPFCVPDDVFSKIAYSLYLTEEDCEALVKMVKNHKIVADPGVKTLIGKYLEYVQKGVNGGEKWTPVDVMTSTRLFLSGTVPGAAQDDMFPGGVIPQNWNSIFKVTDTADNAVPESPAWTWPYLGATPIVHDICYPGFQSNIVQVQAMNTAFERIVVKSDPGDVPTGVDFQAWYENTRASDKFDEVKTALPFMGKEYPVIMDEAVTDKAIDDFLAVIEWRLLTDYFGNENNALTSVVPKWTPVVKGHAPAASVIWGGDGAGGGAAGGGGADVYTEGHGRPFGGADSITEGAGRPFGGADSITEGAGMADDDADARPSAPPGYRPFTPGHGRPYPIAPVIRPGYAPASAGSASVRVPSSFHASSFQRSMDIMNKAKKASEDYVTKRMLEPKIPNKTDVDREAGEIMFHYLIESGFNGGMEIVSHAIDELKYTIEDIYLALEGGSGGGGSGSGGGGGGGGLGGRRPSKEDDVEIVILRPNIEHYMFGIILGKGGEQLGSTFWGQTELSCYDDSQHGIWGMSYKYHERAIVINERNLVRLWDIGYDGYVGGKDDKHLKWHNKEDVHRFKDSTLEVTKHYRGPSMLVMAFSHHRKNDASKPRFKTAYDKEFKQNWPSPIVFYDKKADPGTAHTIGAENTHNMDTSEFRVFVDDIYYDKYVKYRENMAQYDMLHKVRKNAGQASAENESSTEALAFQGSMRVLNNAGNVIQEIHGSGHHGPDFVGVASLRAGKGYKVSTQPTTQRLV